MNEFKATETYKFPNKRDLISKVGEEEYLGVSRALRTAKVADLPPTPVTDTRATEDLPHDVADLIWDADGSMQEKLTLFFEVYDDLPCYGMVMYAKLFFLEFSGSEKEYWWDQVSDRLSTGSESVSDPIEYTLWCDFFEDPETVEGAWKALTLRVSSDKGLRRILTASGPVPYRLKRATYEELAARKDMHQAVFLGLLGSAFDIYGDIEKEHAAQILKMLELEESERLTILERTLNP